VDALSESITEGRDLQLANLQKANKNVSVDKSITISKWVALVLEKADVCFVLTNGLLDVKCPSEIHPCDSKWSG